MECEAWAILGVQNITELVGGMFLPRTPYIQKPA